MNFFSLPVKHTPFVFKNAKGEVIVLCSAGLTDRTLSVYQLQEGKEPVLLLNPETYGWSSICSPWVTENFLCCTLAKTASLQYSIAEFDYRTGQIITDNIFPDLISCDSPCFVEGIMYFTGMNYQTKRQRFHMNSFARTEEIHLPNSPNYQIVSFMKPNVFRVAPDMLALFILAVDSEGKYRTPVYYKKDDSNEWVHCADYEVEGGLFYKPFLFKGNLVSVSRDVDMSVPATSLSVEKIKLSSVWSGFSDYPTDYDFPIILS